MLKRAYQLIIDPAAAWRAVKAEPADIRRLFRGYALPFMLLPVAAAVIRALLARGPYLTFSFGFNLLIGSVVNYILFAAALLFVGWLISVLAQYFSSRSDISSALKLVVYSMTPVWLSSLFSVFPRLSVLSILGFYGAYLVFTGLPELLETPRDKLVAFASSVIVLGIVVMMYLSIVAGGLFYI